MTKAMNNMSTIQSSSIDIAARAVHNWTLTLIAWAIVSAIVTALVMLILYKKTNLYQQIVQEREVALIAESNAEAKRAGESASQANERAEKLEHQNLVLRSEVAVLETHAAAAMKETVRLQQLAAESRKAQHQVAVELAGARYRETEAQLKLEGVRKEQMPRIFSFNFTKFAAALRGKRTGQIVLVYQRDDAEAHEFACKLYWVLSEGGWITTPPTPSEASQTVATTGSMIWPRPSGVQIFAKNIIDLGDSTETVCGVISEAFLAAGTTQVAFPDRNLADDVVRLIVARKL
jgi:hypothetical protein